MLINPRQFLLIAPKKSASAYCDRLTNLALLLRARSEAREQLYRYYDYMRNASSHPTAQRRQRNGAAAAAVATMATTMTARSHGAKRL